LITPPSWRKRRPR